MTGTATLPRRLRNASLEELLQAGWCECGTPLASHPPLPAPAKWGGWTSQKVTPPELRSGSSLVDERRMAERRAVYRRGMTAAIVTRQRSWETPR